MKRQQEIPIRPALTLPEKISIILTSCMPNKGKIDCILVLLESEIQEKDICLNQQKIRQQLFSEILYLFEEIEENQAVSKNKSYIWKRLNLAWRNCRQAGWSFPRDERERKCNYLENLQQKQILIPKKQEKDKGKEKERKERNSGWQKVTWARYGRYYLGLDIQVHKSKKKGQPQRQLLLPLPPNEKEVE